MKIDRTNVINSQQSKSELEDKKASPPTKEKMEAAAIYEKSKLEDNTHVYDKLSIEKLKKESENVYDQLKNMVEKMLKDQGKTFNLLRPGDSVKIDEATRAEAKLLIGDKGPLGIEAMSDKIVDFAKAISGGDKEKLNTLIGAIEKGFKEAQRILGTLPDISQKTYDKIMEKLEIWKNEE